MAKTGITGVRIALILMIGACLVGLIPGYRETYPDTWEVVERVFGVAFFSFFLWADLTPSRTTAPVGRSSQSIGREPMGIDDEGGDAG
ncbi:MAG: hypothetical protein ABS36_05120 [Acidobacteria bacterium SCN 69-37]|nr:MAG: hypothetical protein ABS36_05120 [Acidobacteria bacterium SCN 69-37]